MKRFIIIMVMMLASLGASAQISNIKTTEAVKTITRFRTGLCSFNVHNGVYYLGLISTNQFDDPFLFYLGEGRESAMQTLLDLVELLDTMKKGEYSKFTIQVQGKEMNYEVCKYVRTAFSFVDGRFAGSVTLTRGEMETLIDRFASFELE